MYDTATLVGIRGESNRMSFDKPVAPFSTDQRNVALGLCDLSENYEYSQKTAYFR